MSEPTPPIPVTLTQLREALGDEYLAGRPSFARAAARVKKRSGIDLTREDFERLKNDLRTLEELLNDSKVDLTRFKVRKYVVNRWGKHGDHGQVKAHLVPLDVPPIASITPAPMRTFTTREVRPTTTWMETLLIPDIHFGFRMKGKPGVGEGCELEPLHDESAVYLVLQAALEYQPKVIVLLGDLIDLPTLSKFLSTPDLRYLVQPAIDAAGEFLANLREMCPGARIVYIKGNHEERIDTQLKGLLPDLWEISRAGETKPVMSLAYLLNLEELQVEYIQPYGQRIHINGVMYHHGGIVGKRGGDTVSKLLAKFRGSVVCGHVHRLELAYETFHEEHGEVLVFAMSCGTLARTDGVVPGEMYPNWQKGFGSIDFFGTPHLYPIKGQSVCIDGRVFSALDAPAEDES